MTFVTRLLVARAGESDKLTVSKIYFPKHCVSVLFLHLNLWVQRGLRDLIVLKQYTVPASGLPADGGVADSGRSLQDGIDNALDSDTLQDIIEDNLVTKHLEYCKGFCK